MALIDSGKWRWRILYWQWLGWAPLYCCWGAMWNSPPPSSAVTSVTSVTGLKKSQLLPPSTHLNQYNFFLTSIIVIIIIHFRCSYLFESSSRSLFSYLSTAWSSALINCQDWVLMFDFNKGEQNQCRGRVLMIFDWI